MTAPLTRRLVLEGRSGAPDGAGGTSVSWRAEGAIWASLRPASARERLVGGRTTATFTHRATIRYAPHGAPERPTPDQRFREGERVFAIRGVTEADDRRDRLIVWLEEGASS